MYPTNTVKNIKDLSDRINAVRFAMFTTIDKHGHLTASPMTNQEMDPDGNLWFYTSNDSDLWENIAAEPEVNVSFAEPKDGLYVSVSGTAERVVERAKIKQLWNPLVQAWYPDGPDDPKVCLVRVAAHSAEYWDTASSKMVSLFAMAKAVLTGNQPRLDAEGHRKINL
jgi:general stress protein 26